MCACEGLILYQIQAWILLNLLRKFWKNAAEIRYIKKLLQYCKPMLYLRNYANRIEWNGICMAIVILNLTLIKHKRRIRFSY